MVNNSTNINQGNNDLSSQINEDTKTTIFVNVNLEPGLGQTHHVAGVNLHQCISQQRQYRHKQTIKGCTNALP